MKVLLDSDALFALYVASDVHHGKAKKTFKKLLEQEAELFVTNLVIQETATVISYRFGQKQAKDFLERCNKINVGLIFVNEKLTAKTWKIFKKQGKRGTSFVDCANLAVFKELNFQRIFSFDKIYKKILLIKWGQSENSLLER